jgi:hypothetical protein
LILIGVMGCDGEMPGTAQIALGDAGIVALLYWSWTWVGLARRPPEARRISEIASTNQALEHHHASGRTPS